MHVLVVTFKLDGIEEADYRRVAEELAPEFADVPGLHSMTWLADAGTGTYGGVCHFADRAACAAFCESDLAHTVRTHPQLMDVRLRGFGVLERPTEVTRGPAPAPV